MNELQSSSSDGQPLVDPRAVEQLILDSPPDLPVSQLVELAKTKGVDLDVLQVHRIRDRERKRTARLSAQTAPDEDNGDEGEEEEGEDDESDEDEGDETPESNGASAGSPGQGEAGDGSSPKRRGRKPGGPETRPGFVRSLPLDTPVEEVIRLGRERYGHELDEKYINAIRSKLNPNRRRRQSKKSKETAAAPPAAVTPPAVVEAAPPAAVTPPAVVEAAPPAAVTPPAVVAAASPQPVAVFREAAGVDVRDVEEEFARLVVEIGLVRAEQLLGRVKDRLAQLVRSLAVLLQVAPEAAADLDEVGSDLSAEELLRGLRHGRGQQPRDSLEAIRSDGEVAPDLEHGLLAVLQEAVEALALDRLGEDVGLDAPGAGPGGLIPAGVVGPGEHGLGEERPGRRRDLSASVPDVDQLGDGGILLAGADLDGTHVGQERHQLGEPVAVRLEDHGAREGESSVGGQIHGRIVHEESR